MVTRLVYVLAALILAGAIAPAAAQTRAATAKEKAAIRACVQKNDGREFDIERRCLFKLVAEPCQQTTVGRSNLGTADCHRVEQTIWDDLLNENFKALRDDLDDDAQKDKLRDMQRAWIASRDATCNFFYDKIQGSMAVPMTAACLTRETMRRALLLDAFRGL